MDTTTLATLARTIASQLHAASNHRSSIPYIANPLPKRTPGNDMTLQVLVIGGSIFKKGVFKRINDTLHLIASSQLNQPPFSTKEDFFSAF